MSPDDLDSYLRGLGFTVEVITDNQGNSYTAIRDVTISKGSLAGRICDVALQRLPAIPYQVPAAVHTRPALVPMDMAGPLKTQASALGDEWQYWSRRMDCPPTPQRVWAHVLTVLGEV